MMPFAWLVPWLPLWILAQPPTLPPLRDTLPSDRPMFCMVYPKGDVDPFDPSRQWRYCLQFFPGETVEFWYSEPAPAKSSAAWTISDRASRWLVPW